MSRSLKKNRPSTTGALAEVLLVLAVVLGGVGVYRGWFADPAGDRPTNNDNVQATTPIAAAKVDSGETR